MGLMVWLLPAVSLAAEAAAAPQSGVAMYFAVSIATAGFGLALAAFGGALGQASVGARAMEAIARQPEAGGQIRTAMIIALAFVESLVIYSMLVGLIILFLNPFLKYVAG
jgi:F-type H+-transporting ATPase subunit c